MSNKHNELRSLWVKQRDSYRDWYWQLFNKTIEIKDHFEESFGLKGVTWKEHDSGIDKPYIYVTDFNGKKLTRDLDDHISDDGELFFKMIIVFDHQPNSYPKSLVSVPMAVKFSNNVAMFGIVDTLNDVINQEFGWIESISDYEEKVTKLIQEHFEFDPLVGFDNRNRIGFL